MSVNTNKISEDRYVLIKAFISAWPGRLVTALKYSLLMFVDRNNFVLLSSCTFILCFKDIHVPWITVSSCAFIPLQ